MLGIACLQGLMVQTKTVKSSEVLIQKYVDSDVKFYLKKKNEGKS